ncbi:MAG: ParM/StbA family protein, partial [Candidatus Micrarchaeia archaeon]
MSFAGIDIGYGFTKVVFGNNNENLIFQTTVSKYVRSEKIFNRVPEVISVNEQDYLVGPETTPSWRVDKEFVGSNEYFAVIGYCLAQIYKRNISLSGIALGLPPALFNDRKIIFLRNALEKAEIKLNKTLLPIPEKIIFIPQGVGAYIDFLVRNPEYQRQSVIVIDIGYYTLDIVFIDKGQFIPYTAKSYPAGIEGLFNKICDELSNRYGNFANNTIAEVILQKGSFTYFGKEYKFDASEILRDYYIPKVTLKLKEYANFLRNEEFNLDSISAIVVAGGGAVYLKNILEDAIVLPEPQFANARGYKIYVEQDY